MYRNPLSHELEADGTAGIEASLGNPRSIGLDVQLSLLDLSRTNGQGGFGQRGSVDLKVHHLFRGDLSLAAGTNQAVNWGGTDALRGGYLVATKAFHIVPAENRPFSRLYVTGGIVGGQYGSLQTSGSRSLYAALVGSAALSVIPSAQLIAEWNGYGAGVGLTMAPLKGVPFTVAATMSDVGDGSRWGNLFLIATYSFHVHSAEVTP